MSASFSPATDLPLRCTAARHVRHSLLTSSPMQPVHIAAFDLNLLPVFDALWSERNVTRAARRVGLTQPALSHALGRLREQLGDPLFQPSPSGMMPTPRAQ